jgi:hypothetical protein
MRSKAHRRHSASSVVGTGLLLVIPFLLVAAVSHTRVSAHPQMEILLSARYVETMEWKDASRAPAVVENGTCLIDPKGRYRIERLRGTSRTVEIVDVRQNRRSVLDLDKKRVVAGSRSEVSPGTRSLPGGPVIVESAGSGWRQRQGGQTLGTKVIAGGLTVEGSRFVFNIAQADARLTLTQENWYYVFGDRRLGPVMMEQKFEVPNTITTREVTDVSELPMDESLFVVPASFAAAGTAAPRVVR